MKKYVIGDIHGRWEALKEVLTKCKFNYEKDKLIVLGDVVDGGYRTYEVVEELLKIKHLVYIVGNHDEWFMNHIKSGWVDHIWLSQGGENTIKSYMKENTLTIPVTHQDFFNRGVYWHEEDNCMFVHGGFKPKLHPKDETRQNLLWDRNIINVARLYHKTGKKIGKWDKVFIGHTTTQYIIKGCVQPLQFANLWMLDTGAGWTGTLSIMNIKTEKYCSSSIQEPAR